MTVDWKTIGIGVSIVGQIIGIGIIFYKIAYGQGKARIREIQFGEDINSININLNNHITTIAKHISDIKNDMATVKERVSGIEGYMEGVKNGKNT